MVKDLLKVDQNNVGRIKWRTDKQMQALFNIDLHKKPPSIAGANTFSKWFFYVNDYIYKKYVCILRDHVKVISFNGHLECFKYIQSYI